MHAPGLNLGSWTRPWSSFFRYLLPFSTICRMPMVKNPCRSNLIVSRHAFLSPSQSRGSLSAQALAATRLPSAGGVASARQRGVHHSSVTALQQLSSHNPRPESARARAFSAPSSESACVRTWTQLPGVARALEVRHVSVTTAHASKASLVPQASLPMRPFVSEACRPSRLCSVRPWSLPVRPFPCEQSP